MWQWGLAILGALLIGVSKTGFSGAGILAVAIFAQILAARASTGIVLPLLISADVVAVTAFRRHAVWHHLWRMFPWTAAGIVAGYFAMAHINDAQVKQLIGWILVVLVGLQFARKLRDVRARPTTPATRAALQEVGHSDYSSAPPPPASGGEARNEQGWVPYVASMGLLAGFTTMTANAAGPIMILYLLAVGLPKMEFVGTGAWFFLIINLFKIPFSYEQGLINGPSLLFDLKIAPVAIAGALWGRVLVKKINQPAFEIMALAFAIIGAIRLLVK
jgi:uncharacterized membrane protein YfcA